MSALFPITAQGSALPRKSADLRVVLALLNVRWLLFNQFALIYAALCWSPTSRISFLVSAYSQRRWFVMQNLSVFSSNHVSLSISQWTPEKWQKCTSIFYLLKFHGVCAKILGSGYKKDKDPKMCIIWNIEFPDYCLDGALLGVHLCFSSRFTDIISRWCTSFSVRCQCTTIEEDDWGSDWELKTNCMTGFAISLFAVFPVQTVFVFSFLFFLGMIINAHTLCVVATI